MTDTPTQNPPLESDAEVFAPERTAVILVDLQNDFIPGGALPVP